MTQKELHDLCTFDENRLPLTYPDEYSLVWASSQLGILGLFWYLIKLDGKEVPKLLPISLNYYSAIFANKNDAINELVMKLKVRKSAIEEELASLDSMLDMHSS